MESEAKPVSLTAKIAAEILLGKIRLSPHWNEPRYLQPVREVVMQLRRAVGGNEGYAALSEELQPAVHALADLLADAVAGVGSEKTAEKLKKLPVPYRLAAEQTAAALTGKIDPRDYHWQDDLWHLKGYIDRVVSLSVSGITPEEIREGFDTIIHGGVDALFEKKGTLIS